MYKYFTIISIVSLFCFSALFWSCDDQSKMPGKPKVVSKKVITKTKKTKQAVKTKRSISTKPDLAKKPKADISKIKDVKTSKKPLDLTPKSKKLTLKPKADISKIRIAIEDKKPDKKPTVSKKDSEKLIAKKDIIKPKPDASKARDGSPPRKTIKATGTTTGVVESSTTPSPYNPYGKIDPFEPLFKEQTVIAAVKKRKKRIPQTPLEKISLSQLKLVGIIRASSGNKALVEESSGKGFVIKKGTYIGLNSGKVIKIQKDNVIIEEEFENVLGNLVIRQRELKLHKPSGEK